MKVLVVGKGGRESAIVWKLDQSEEKFEIFTAPGNPFTARYAQNIPIKENDVRALIDFALKEGIDLIFPGGETSIGLGIADEGERRGIKVLAPKRDAARLETSKIWAKSFAKKYRIPTADFEVFTDEEFDDAVEYVKGQTYPIVIKADGLAGGKGVVIANSVGEAINTLDQFMNRRKFGEASRRVVIEKFLKGEEASVFAVADGYRWKVFAYARDYKRLLDGDRGPNTGGMGSISPVILDRTTRSLIEENVVKRTFEGLAKEGLPYKGFLYFGLMLTENGPFLLEYNVRLGDPETQAILPILDYDFGRLILSAAVGKLEIDLIKKCNRFSCCVVAASRGYPENPITGFPITGIEEAERIADVVFLAGVKEKDGQLLTDGGRVLSVVATGDSLEEARRRTYEGLSRIHFEGMHYRRDVGM
ncbi:MAG: phosphoribosylamine--glycine ligase [Thermotogae bacterium]|nr:phosphoribosylamine--glycine ligase [Thermotogota bacterium]